MEYEPDPKRGHQAGNDRPVHAAQGRIPVPTACEKSPRKTRHRPAEIQNRHLRSWMLLAPAQGLQIRHHALHKQKVLAAEICPQHRQ